MNRRSARMVVDDCGARMRFNTLTRHFVFHDASNNPYSVSGARMQDMSKEELRHMLTRCAAPADITAAKALIQRNTPTIDNDNTDED